MELLQPALLWILPALGVLALIYVAAVGRALRRGVVSYPLWLAADAAASARPFRRYLPPGLFLAGLAAVVLGVARPVILWPSPARWPVVIIIDVSRSMEEEDIKPTRIEATKTAAIEFVDGLPRGARVALVTFGNYATTVVPLTGDHERMRAGIRAITTQLRTQLGNGLVEGVRAVVGEGSANPDGSGPPGRPTAIAVLLSDGRASDGILPMEAAEEARRRGVRVYTVGVGTDTDPMYLRSGYWGVLDEPTLRAIAAATGGQYFKADEASRLREVYRDLARVIGWESKPTEVTALAGGLALVFIVASIVLRNAVYPIH
jgi:Ca-activated chloride channel family protein